MKYLIGKGGKTNMDIARTYSEENLHLLFKKISETTEKSEQILDFLKLLLKSADDNKNGQKDIITKLLGIEKTTADINNKMDIVLEKLNSIENDFADLKSERRELEQKITLMILKLQKLEDSISDEEIEDYCELAEKLYANWDSLDVLTKKFIPLAEYLYSKLQKYDKADYSPVILELCRAIENEFLLKIFRKYTLDCIKRKGKELYSFFAIDRSDKELSKKTGQFVKAINKAYKTRKPEYTLGQMNAILSMLNDEQIVNASPVLQDFKKYLIDNTEAAMLLDSDYIKKINDIVNDYRNPSAHPDFMGIEKANECREVMPERIDYLMDCVG